MTQIDLGSTVAQKSSLLRAFPTLHEKLQEDSTRQ